MFDYKYVIYKPIKWHNHRKNSRLSRRIPIEILRGWDGRGSKWDVHTKKLKHLTGEIIMLWCYIWKTFNFVFFVFLLDTIELALCHAMQMTGYCCWQQWFMERVINVRCAAVQWTQLQLKYTWETCRWLHDNVSEVVSAIEPTLLCRYGLVFF